MKPDQWEKVKEIFGDALDREPAERESFVREAAGGDAALLTELLRMLKENERDTDLLSKLALADPKALRQEEKSRFETSALLARRFRIVRFISRGGMGEVYEAEDLELGERVALKAIRPSVSSDPELRALFKREVQLARRVTHPNVCRIFDLHEHSTEVDGAPILLLSMEMIEGRTLAEYLRIMGPLGFRDALPLIEQIAAGLQAVHDAGVIHGDLKPGNVMLASRPGDAAPHARVMDFGVALPMGASNSGNTSSSPGLRGGTPDYLAPEQSQGAPATTGTDVYALALVIADLLGVPRATRLKPDQERMPARWARLLRRCLADDPERRISRPADLAEALRASLNTRWRVGWSAVALAVVVFGVLIAARRLDVMHAKANVLLLTETRAESVETPSPSGQFLAGASWDTGDLILREVSTGKVRRLTHKSTTWDLQFGGAYDSIFSPDGRQIAYQWMNSRVDGEVRIIGTNGKGERALYHSPNTIPRLLDWSHDGRRILFELDEGSNSPQLALLSPQDGSVQPISKPLGHAHALFAPDGSIVFDSRAPQSEVSEIHRLSADGVESTLVGRTGSNSIVGWSPDGRRLIFSSDRRGYPGIWAVPVSDRGTEGEPRELVPNAKDWDPLGLTRTGTLFYRNSVDLHDVYTAVVDLAAARTISPPKRVNERFLGSYNSPNWSEDGRQLVFSSNRDLPTPGLGIYDLPTGQVRELRLDLQWANRPQWVEHGAAIMVFGAAKDGRQGQFRIDPQTGAASFVRSAHDLESHLEGVWSRDGKFHFNRFDNFRRGIFRLNTATGERRILYVPPQGVDVAQENLALSPDERTLAFHARSRDGTASLMLVPPGGDSQARPLFTVKNPDSFWYGSFAWTPDSRKILAVVTNKGRLPKDELVSEIWQVPVDGSAPSKIDFPKLWIMGLRLNPDGKTLAFGIRRWRNEIWLLQNFL